MPIVIPHFKRSWLPTIADLDLIEAYRQSEGNLQPKQALTRSFLHYLPGIVIHAVNEVDSDSLKASEALVLPQVIHPWSVNAYDWWLDIQPGDAEEWADRKERRWEAARLIKVSITSWLDEAGGKDRPVFDVECRPIDGSGTSTNDLGIVINEWGKPKDAPSLIGVES